MSTESERTESERYGLTIKDEALDHARAIADARHISLAEAVRRSLSVLRAITDQEANGAVVKFHLPSGEVERLLLL